jgi:hypothetical protein
MKRMRRLMRLLRPQESVPTLIVRSHAIQFGSLSALGLLTVGNRHEITGLAGIDCIRRAWLLLRRVKKIWTIELGLLQKRLTILGIIFGLK